MPHIIEYSDFTDAFASLRGKKVEIVRDINERYKKGTVWTISVVTVNHGIPVAYLMEEGCIGLNKCKVL